MRYVVKSNGITIGQVDADSQADAESRVRHAYRNRPAVVVIQDGRDALTPDSSPITPGLLPLVGIILLNEI